MKSLPVSADLVTWLLTGPTRQRASPIFHPKVGGDGWHIWANALWTCLITCPTVFRVRIPAVSRRELCPGPDRCLHSGGWQTVPLCLQPNHQRQACKSSPVLNCVLSVLLYANTNVQIIQTASVFVCLVIVSERVGNFTTAVPVLCLQKWLAELRSVCSHRYTSYIVKLKKTCHLLVCKCKSMCFSVMMNTSWSSPQQHQMMNVSDMMDAIKSGANPLPLFW